MGNPLIDLIEIAVKRHDGASARRLADIAQRAGHSISHTTLNRLRQGTYASRPADGSIRAIAYLAGVPDTAAFAAAGILPPATDHYRPPAEAQRMTTRQRKALDELVRAFVTEKHAPAVASLGKLLAARDALASALERDTDTRLADPARATVIAIDEFCQLQ